MDYGLSFPVQLWYDEKHGNNLKTEVKTDAAQKPQLQLTLFKLALFKFAILEFPLPFKQFFEFAFVFRQLFEQEQFVLFPGPEQPFFVQQEQRAEAAFGFFLTEPGMAEAGTAFSSAAPTAA